MIRLSLTGDKYENETLDICLTVYKDQSGEILFVGKEVASGLGYAKTRNAITRHVHEEDRYVMADTSGDHSRGPLSNIQPHQVLINESGLYSLLLSSRLPKALEFKRWITKEVLPSIRRTRLYALPEVLMAIKGIEPDDVRGLDQGAKGEFRRVSKSLSDLAKNPDKVSLGKIGGEVAQARIRGLKEDQKNQKLQIKTLENENKSLKIRNWDLQLDVQDVIDWAKDFRKAKDPTGD